LDRLQELQKCLLLRAGDCAASERLAKSLQRLELGILQEVRREAGARRGDQVPLHEFLSRSGLGEIRRQEDPAVEKAIIAHLEGKQCGPASVEAIMQKLGKPRGAMNPQMHGGSR